jgi:hypothetical protein
MDKQNVVHLSMQYYLEIKRNEVLINATAGIDFENMVSERNQT